MFFQTIFHSWKHRPRFFNFFRPFLNIKRQQKNTQAKLLEKIAAWWHALLSNGHHVKGLWMNKIRCFHFAGAPWRCGPAPVYRASGESRGHIPPMEAALALALPPPHPTTPPFFNSPHNQTFDFSFRLNQGIVWALPLYVWVLPRWSCSLVEPFPWPACRPNPSHLFPQSHLVY